MEYTPEQHLAVFLKKKRQSIEPMSLGYDTARRRTPGLRREEVAQRAHISVTWYTWLEQGRGGAPSEEVLSRIAKALLLTDAEKEYLYLTTLGHLPKAEYQLSEVITPQLQSILDALSPNPAIIRNLSWDVLAWNDAATAVLTDYPLLAPEDRNIMRLFFLKNEVKAHSRDWVDTANLIVSAFRTDIARLGETEHTEQLLVELLERSDVFKTLWTSQQISHFNEGVKCLNKPEVGEISLGYSSFNISSRPELSLIVYTPQSEASLAKVKQLIDDCKK
ncbi:helix-turn-helix transcriptional regulator [Marinomonas spartinae]|uniref:helix-turn-helix transcriptional regulator n=1 Tax=Marinomonas spartinae TaxID=1792290 RepID=UPI0018F23A1D|nr:helix-turn-helix transcriptional regulator [Marinomonas spartinae]MBJ7555544.1 helix-turn-helix domain-containing protein [Marinomonas spartinae]